TPPVRSRSTPRSGGVCARIWRFRPWRFGSATRSRISSRLRRSQPSCTRSAFGSPAPSTTASRCRTWRLASSRRTCGARSGTVSDLLVQTLYTVSSLGYRRLSEEQRDLEQARLAIEALRALLPVLEGSVAEELVRDFKQVTANLQLAYADAAKGVDEAD